MKVNAGALDRRIELLSPSKAKSTVGQVQKEFAPVATVYGERMELRTVDAARAGQRDAFAMAKFIIRYRTGVTTAMRIKVDNRTYDVVAVDEPDRRAVLVLTVQEVLK
ncbi:phage head closure protein [Sphingomonas sp. NFX23]